MVLKAWIGQVPLILGPSSWGAGGIPLVSAHGPPAIQRPSWTRIQVEDWVNRTAKIIEAHPDCRRQFYDQLRTWLSENPEESAVYFYEAGDPEKLNETLMCTGQYDRPAPLGQIKLTTASTSTPIEVQKSQQMRLLDVFVLGPFMVGMAFISKPPPVLRALLAAAGAGTILYNLQNYLKTRGQLDQSE